MRHYLDKLEEVTRKYWDKPSLCNYGGEKYTYGMVATTVAKFHTAFAAAGLGKGVKMAICGRNTARWAISFWAVNTYEAVAVPIMADFPPESIERLTDHSESVVMFTDPDIWERLDESRMPKLRAVVSLKDFTLLYSADKSFGDVMQNLDALFAQKYPDGFRQEDVKYPKDNWDDLAIINYTSGTTSDPKGVMLTYKALSDTDEFSNTHFPNTPEDNIVSMLPLAHMYGLAIEFVHPNVDGVAVYFLGKTPSPSTLLKAMAEVRPYMVITVPLVMEKIYKSAIKPVISKEPVRTLLTIPGVSTLIYRKIRDKVNQSFGGKVRCYIMGGAALNPEVERCFKKMKLQYMVGYGMTEACPLLGWEWWTDFVPGSCGKPVHELRIDSEDPHRIPGEIQVRGDNMTTGYYKNPEATAAAFTEDGWFRTGDLGVVDADNNIFIRGRIKSMILSANGQNVYPEEIEAVLGYMDGVAECLAVDRGGKIVAMVYPEQSFWQSLDAEAKEEWPEKVKAAANAKLPAYSHIAKVEVRSEPFEKTPKMSVKRYLYK